jgi:hypothetical protein
LDGHQPFSEKFTEIRINIKNNFLTDTYINPSELFKKLMLDIF